MKETFRETPPRQRTQEPENAFDSLQQGCAVPAGLGLGVRTLLLRLQCDGVGVNSTRALQ